MSQTDEIVKLITEGIDPALQAYIDIAERLEKIEAMVNATDKNIAQLHARLDDDRIPPKLEAIDEKLDSIIEVFGGLEKMMDQLKSEGMGGLLKMMRGKS